MAMIQPVAPSSATGISEPQEKSRRAKMHNKRSLFLKNSPFLILTGFLREGNIYQIKALAIRRIIRR